MVKGPRKQQTQTSSSSSEDGSSCWTRGRGGYCWIMSRFLLVIVGGLWVSVDFQNWKDVKLLQPVVEGTKNLTRLAISHGNSLNLTTKLKLATTTTTTMLDDSPKEGSETRAELDDPSNHPKGSIEYYIALSRQQKHDKERILYLLRDHGRISNISADQYEALPTWKQVTDLYGSQPKLVGANPDQCKAFQSRGSTTTGQRRRKYLAVAGMFNTGTNLLANTLFQNCVIDPPDTTVPTTILPVNPGASTTGICWQVETGKHTPARNESFRRKAYKTNSIPYDDVLPVVMIRDPMWWMMNLCTSFYTTHWPKLYRPDHPNYHCPSLWPTNEELAEFPKRNLGPIVVGVNDETFASGKEIPTGNIDHGINPYLRGQPTQNSTLPDDIGRHHYFPIHVVYDETKRHHYSMVHLWNEWNQGHYEAYDDSTASPAHRIMLRFEDLLFHTQQVIEQVCQCAGGHLITKRAGEEEEEENSAATTSSVRIPTKSAKANHEIRWNENQDRKRHGYLEGLILAGNATKRLEPFTSKDLQYANYHLRKELMKEFQYQYPTSP